MHVYIYSYDQKNIYIYNDFYISYIYIYMYISDSIHFLNIYSLEFIYQFTISMVFYFL